MTTEQGKQWKITLETERLAVRWEGPNLALYFVSDADWDEACSDKAGWSFIDRRCADGEKGLTVVSDRFRSGGVELVREVCYDPDHLSSMEMRFIARNIGSTVIRLDRFVPLSASGKHGLLLGQAPPSQWVFSRSGRQKNDLPSVCVLGINDDAYKDALSGLSESGKHKSAETEQHARELVSDELTVISAGKDPGAPSITLGFLNAVHHLASCRIRLNEHGEEMELLEAACEWDGVPLAPGEEREGSWLLLEAASPFEAASNYVTRKKATAGSVASPHPPSVYCTWYYYGDTVGQEDVFRDLKALRERHVPIGVVQIDEGWELRLGLWEANHRFPGGMEAAARRIQEAGYRPGIWTAPFIVEPRADVRFYHDDWLLRNKDGELVLFYMNQTHNLVWDVTHPEVQAWIEALYRKLTAWGYTYHKLDFTRAVALDENVRFYNPNVTRAEAYRMGMEAVRRGIGPEGYLLICGGLFTPASGLADAHRTSSDVLSMWSEHDGRQGGKVAPFTMKQNVLRYWMNELWHNDPDALMVRRRKTRIRSLDLSLGLLTDDEARVSALNQYWGGGLVCFSEPMDEIEDDRLGLLRHIVPSLGKAAVPRDMFEGARYPRIMDTEWDRTEAGLGRWHTVSLVNWSDEGLDAAVRLDEQLVGSFASEYETFTVSEFWSGKIIRGVKLGELLQFSELPPHASLHLRITPEVRDTAVLIHTNGHFSMGASEAVKLERQGDRVLVELMWRWKQPLELVLAPPAGFVWDGQSIGGAGAVLSLEEELLRISVPGEVSGQISLQLKADKQLQ